MLRNVRLTGAGRKPNRYTTSTTTIEKMAAAKNPTGGEMTRLVTCLARADHCTPFKPPAAAMPDPHNPPISAWVELLGRPRYHVIRFQAIAPNSAAMTTPSPGLMARVLAIVFDTLAWKNATVTIAPIRLKTAASATAACGDSARVEMEVAIALAVSWKPLVKSNTIATPMVTQRRIAVSRIFNRDRFHDVGRMLTCVHGGFQQIVDVLPLDQLCGVADLREQASDCLAGDAVTFVFQSVDLQTVGLQLSEAFQPFEGACDLRAGLGEVLTHRLGSV